jgi:hypothetical protein
MFMKYTTSVNFISIVMATLEDSKVIWNVLKHCIQNMAQFAHFAMAESYTSKMIMKFTTGVAYHKTFYLQITN